MRENGKHAATWDNLGDFKDVLVARLDTMEHRLAQRIDRFETTILNAVYSCSRAQDLRLTALEPRVSAVESRLVEIELHLGMRGPNQV